MERETADKMKGAVCISALETQEILYLNQTARDYFAQRISRPGLTSARLFFDSPETIRAYAEADISDTHSCFQILADFMQGPFPQFLDSTVVQFEGRPARVDVLNISDYDLSTDDFTYLLAMQSVMTRLERAYRPERNLQENINTVLDTILCLYGGDRAFIYEVDFELNYAVDIYERFRPGFVAKQEMRKDLQQETMARMHTYMEQGIPFVSGPQMVTSPYYQERMRRHKVIRTMSAPFSRRTGMNCFLGVDNARRYYKRFEYLRIAMYMLAADLETDRQRANRMAAQKLMQRRGGDVQIRLFGGFEIETVLGCLQRSDFSSPLCCTLLLFLLSNRKRVVSVREIAEVLWPEEILDNPYNMVKSVVFRTRKILEGICPQRLIVASKGTYMIDRDLRIHIDSEEFESLCQQASARSKPPEERLALYEKAMELYRGGMLPGFESELWLMARISYFQLLYADAVTEYTALLAESKRYLEMFRVASKAMEVDYLDGDLHFSLIKTLAGSGRYELAKSYYFKVEKRLTAQQREEFQRMWRTYLSQP